DGTALVQELVESQDGAIVRVEVLDDRYLYAIRIVRPASDFNLCPADICRLPETPPSADLSACPVEVKPGLHVTRYDAPPAVVDQARALARAGSIDVGGIEYLVGRDDGRVYFYDVNATSNFVANAPAVLGFDPFPQLADYIVRVATGAETRRTA
ncbi:MAG: ATP-grasp domain-containing protein, partial [Candidatus Rokuibacteriota bacterium]